MRKKCGGRDPLDSTCHIYYNVSMHDHLFQLDLDGQVTCSSCHCMDDEQDNSGSYNGSRAVSETDNEGPIPSPEAMFETQMDFE